MLVRKEAAALLPLWLSCVAALIAAQIWPGGLLREAAIVAYVVGPLAIGAHAIGQEHLHRTLALLLTQPLDRRRLYATKMLVAAVMVLTIAALAPDALASDLRRPGMWQHRSVQLLPLAGGIGAAPWFAMIGGGTLAGVLFPASVAGLTFIFGSVFVAWWSGAGLAAAQSALLEPWALTMNACCAAGAVLGTQRFIRLEAIDGAAGALFNARWFERTATVRRPRSPIAALISKELHLQQMTFVLAALFTIVSLALALLRRQIPAWSHVPTEVVTTIYCGTLAILSGALASAEERQHGTLEWQLLQPTPAWQQWSVKVAVTFGLALIFGAAMPALLLRHTATGAPPAWLDLAVPVGLITAATLYISSLVNSGVTAMVLSLPSGLAVAIVIQGVDQIVRHRPAGGGVVAALPIGLAFAVPSGVAVISLLLLVRLAFVNHTSIDRPWRRVAVHGAMFAFLVAFGTFAELLRPY